MQINNYKIFFFFFAYKVEKDGKLKMQINHTTTYKNCFLLFFILQIN